MLYDRPNIDELLSAAIQHFETQVSPAVKGDARLYFQTLVAINVLKIAQRELVQGWSHLATEWASLDVLEGVPTELPAGPEAARAALAERQRQLATRIRAGNYDDSPTRPALFEHLLTSVQRQLEVANPKFLQALAQEDRGS